MRNILVILILFLFSFAVFGEVVIPGNNSSVFAKYDFWAVKNDKDIEKNVNDVKEKILLKLGNKLTVTGNKKIGEKIYLNVQLPSKEKYWAPMDYVAVKFITITQNDLACFGQPDVSYAEKYKLNAGLLGYYVKTSGEFINIDVVAYTMNKATNQVIWIQNTWIKANSGYTDDTQIGMQASYLATAYYYLYNPKAKNVTAAIAKLKEALKAGEGINSPIDSVINDLIQQLDTNKTSQFPIKSEEKIGAIFAPTIDTLRFRETPTTDGKVIRTLVMGEKLKLIENGAEGFLNDVKGYWKKFETEKGEKGWCFDGFLQPVN